MVTWQCKHFTYLTKEELYKILQLRIEVFAVEQNVVYQDCDNKDLTCYHLTAKINDAIIAYSRILPPGVAYPDAASIGRVVTAHSVRRQSFGKQLFEKSLEALYNLFGNVPVTISAQFYLVKFYEQFSFTPKGEMYLEDSILHITMVRNYSI
jgi:ElaA protein